jgi:hypothetical protein
MNWHCDKHSAVKMKNRRSINIVNVGYNWASSSSCATYCCNRDKPNHFHIFHWYNPSTSNGILFIVLVQQEGTRELQDSFVDWVQSDLANINLNTQFQSNHYHNCAHHVVQQSQELEPVNPPSGLRETVQVEHILGKIHVVVAITHVFL